MIRDEFEKLVGELVHTVSMYPNAPKNRYRVFAYDAVLAAFDEAKAEVPARVPNHGSASEYSNHGCRCQDCRDAHRQAIAKRRDERSREPVGDRHGLVSTYTNWRCRCVECKAAHSTSLRARKAVQP